ncbi:MAG TPA: hypothetical protein VMH00_01475 [Candidatus Limnocylindrales bacterium]|nr:hypothetical protein [Candidatus Limnocylindrales bacterium]
MNALNAISPIRIDSSYRGVKPEQTLAEKIRSGGSACFHVFDRSLFPWVRPGDQAFVRRFDFKSLAAGDVILTERNGRLALARVVKRFATRDRGISFIAKGGGAAESGARRLERGEFLGKVIRVHRRRKHIDLESLSYVTLGRALAAMWRMAAAGRIREEIRAAEMRAKESRPETKRTSLTVIEPQE